MHRTFLSLWLVLLVFTASSLPLSNAHAQTAVEIQAKIDAHNAQIQALQVEIAKYQQQVDTLGKQKNTLESTVRALALSQKQLAAELQVTQNKIDAATLSLEQLGVAIGAKEVSIAKNQAAIAKAMRHVAQNEDDSLVAQLLNSESLTDAWHTTDEAIQLNKALAEQIAALRSVRQELAENRDAVAKAKETLLSLKSDLTIQKKSVDLSKIAQQRLLSDTKNQESVYQKLIADKKAEESAFEAALFDLASQLEYALDPSKIPKAGKGVLRWPLDAVFITQQFGQTSASGRLYTSGTHNGVDFRAAIGTPVRAAGSGTVLEVNVGAIQNCQYGKWVLIRHSNGLATLYAHLTDITVQKNDVIAMGQVIGYSGSTGYATGPHLHLGVFFADAVSFRQYTCKNGRAVTIPIAPVKAYLDPLIYL